MDNSRTSTALVAKQIPSSFKNDRLTLSPAARAVASLDLSTCSEAYRCLFMSSKKAFRSYLMIFMCALAKWLRSSTVEISDVPSMYR